MTGMVHYWAAPFGIGFALSFSLIMAIGAQNTYVLRQGLMRQHIGPLVAFCALSDAVLIIAGVAGLAPLLAQWLGSIEQWLFFGASVWLGTYGLIRGYAAWHGTSSLQSRDDKQSGLTSTLGMAVILTFGNPHVYLDTVMLIGTVSLRFENVAKVAFTFGAISASFIFFIGLGYGAEALSSLMQRPHAWRILDGGVALVMFALAFGMVSASGLL